MTLKHELCSLGGEHDEFLLFILTYQVKVTTIKHICIFYAEAKEALLNCLCALWHLFK